MNRDEMLKKLIDEAESPDTNGKCDSFSPSAMEIIRLLRKYRMYTGNFDLIIRDENLPEAVKEAIEEMRSEIFQKVERLSPMDFRKPEFAIVNDEFMGFTSKEKAQQLPELPPLTVKPDVSDGMAERLKENLDKALAEKDAEFARNKMILSLAPIIMDAIQKGLGIAVIYQHIAGAGFSWSQKEFVDYLKELDPYGMGEYTCGKDGAIIMKMPVRSGAEFEMQWVCPECGTQYNREYKCGMKPDGK